jgi:ABC-2 type transport system permease protein
MAAALENYPQAIMDALGLEDMVSPAGYLQSTVFGIIGPLLLLIFAGGAGARAIAGDEEAGTLDLLLASTVSQAQVLLQRRDGRQEVALLLDEGARRSRALR